MYSNDINSFNLNATKLNGSGVATLFETLDSICLSPSDRFCLDYMCGVVVVTINRWNSGLTERIFFKCNQSMGLGEFELFDPSSLSRKERDKFIRAMRDRNVSQRKIAEIMGVTQQAISHICRKKA
jgi:hypothetical protein